MKYVCIRQYDDTGCGAACLVMVSKTYKIKTSISKVRELAGTDSDGTSALGMIKAANKLGLDAKGLKVKREAFYEATRFAVPCIAHVVINNSIQHYVVIHKITNNHIIIADPAKGIVKLTREEFFGLDKTKEGRLYNWTGLLIVMKPKVKYRSENFENKGFLRTFFPIVLAEKSLLINIVIASILSSFLGMGTAFYYSTLIDTVLPERLGDTLIVVSLATIGLYLVKEILNFFRTQMMVYFGQKIDINVILSYYKHSLQLPMNFYGTRKTGEIISRIDDASNVRNTLSAATLTLMIDTGMCVFGAVILYRENWKMFLVTVLNVAICTIIVFASKRIFKKLNIEQMETDSQLTSYLIESFNGIQTVKSFNAEKTIVSNTEKNFVKSMKSGMKLGVMCNIQASILSIINSVGGVIILWIGATSVIRGEMSIGEIIAYEALASYFLGPINNIINLQPQLQTASVSAERLREIMDVDAEKINDDNKVSIDDLKGDIELSNVSFKYGEKKKVLDNVNMSIKKGQKVAFVGESGSGKSTLAKLLLHFYDVESGEISINGYNINDITIDSLRNKVSYIPQDTFLYSGTIYENLTFGRGDYKVEDVVNATKKARAYDFIEKLPLKLNTKLGENGGNLSGGQRQRLSIARSLLKDADILILDEATSSLDTSTETMLQKELEEFAKDKTTITIAHRLSTIKNCDRIFVFEEGKIIEQGTHEELIKFNGKYAELVSQQSLEVDCA